MMLRKYFFKRVRTYFFIMIIPTLILFILIGYFLISVQQRQIREEGENSLNSFNDSLEASLYNMGYQLDVLMSNSSFSLSLKNLLGQTSMQQNDRIVFDMLKYFFNSYQSAYEYVHSVYLYLDGKERFLTSASGQIANINTYYDVEWYQEYQDMGRDDRMFTSRRWIERYTYEEPVEVISLYYRTTYLDGVIVINVDKGKYGQLLRNALVSEKQKIFLFNSKGIPVCTTDNSLEGEDLEKTFSEKISPYLKNGNYEKLNYTWQPINGHYYYLYSQYSDYLDLYQTSAIAMNYLFSEIFYYILLVFMILILDITGVLLLSYFYTKRSFFFIQECVNIFSQAERGGKITHQVSEIKDEYGIILNNIIYLYLKNNKMQMDLLEQKHQNEITEMIALQLQINPHFIFNTLQIMDFEIIKKLGIQSVLHKMTQQLSQVVKYALTNPTEKVSLGKELAYLKAYLEIQKVRFGKNAITYFEVDECILNCEVFRLLLQPMVENCFEHGMRSDEEPIVIKLKIFDKKKYIYFAVLDDGKGMDKKDVEKLINRINNKTSRNIGLTNLNRRLILHYGQGSALRIQSRENRGMVIHFTIPKDCKK